MVEKRGRILLDLCWQGFRGDRVPGLGKGERGRGEGREISEGKGRGTAEGKDLKNLGYLELKR